MKPFDFVNSISFNKKNLMRGTENDEQSEKEYTPYLSNKALSYYPDTILYSNEMNKLSHLDNILQYEYLLNSIRPNKRFSKWAKKEVAKEVLAIGKYFKISNRQAEEYLKLLSPDKIKEIVSEIEKI